MVEWIYEHIQLVFNVNKADMGATELAVWAGVDGAVCDHCHIFRYSILQSIYWQARVDGGTAVCVEPRIQLFIYLFSIWTQE